MPHTVEPVRTDLIESVRETLARAGFAVSERCDLRPVSFDLVARRDSQVLIVKVLGNVEGFPAAVADEVKTLCKFLDAQPIIVGLRAATGPLEDGVVYWRHGVPAVTPATLWEQVLEGNAPAVEAGPGGYFVHIDGGALHAARLRHDMSLGLLAQVAGVSRRAIHKYEQGGMGTSIEAALRLEEFLDEALIRPLDPLAAFQGKDYTPPEAPAEDVDPMEALVTRFLEGLGYEVRRTGRSPFQALSTQSEDTLLTGMGADSPRLRRRARVVQSVSRIVERPGFFVVERTTRTEIHGMPVVSRTELRRLTDPDRIRDLITERGASGEASG